MDLDKLEEIKEQLLELSEEELFYVVKNTYYAKVAYWNDKDKGPIYDGSHSDINIEQATRLQQHIRSMTDLFNQSMGGRVFDNDYFEDLLTDNYYGKYKQAIDDYKEKALIYDSLCD